MSRRVRGVMVDGRLEPKLTKLDRRVLAAIPFDGSLWAGVSDKKIMIGEITCDENTY